MPGADLAAAKIATRQRVLALRDALSASERSAQSATITDMLLSLPEVARASTVGAYMSFGSEIEIDAFSRKMLATGKRLSLPRMVRGTRELSFYAVNDLDHGLLSGPWGIREPDPQRCPVVSSRDLDLVLVPGVAFTTRCERLGYGGGFYDRVISQLAPGAVTVAATFSLQMVDVLPLEEHDLRVGAVITELGIYRGEGL